MTTAARAAALSSGFALAARHDPAVGLSMRLAGDVPGTGNEEPREHRGLRPDLIKTMCRNLETVPLEVLVEAWVLPR